MTLSCPQKMTRIASLGCCTVAYSIDTIIPETFLYNSNFTCLFLLHVKVLRFVNLVSNKTNISSSMSRLDRLETSPTTHVAVYVHVGLSCSDLRSPEVVADLNLGIHDNNK